MKRLLLSLILLSFILSVVSEGVGFWRRLDPVPVAGAPGQAIVGTGEHLFLIRTDGETNASQFWTYDGDDRRWTDRSEDIIVGFDDQDNNDRRGLSDGLFQTGTAMAWVNDDDDDNFLYILGGGTDDGDLHGSAVLQADVGAPAVLTGRRQLERDEEFVIASRRLTRAGPQFVESDRTAARGRPEFGLSTEYDQRRSGIHRR